MENFFGLLKSELLYLEKFTSYEDFINKLRDYIDYYNTKRIKLKQKLHTGLAGGSSFRL